MANLSIVWYQQLHLLMSWAIASELNMIIRGEKGNWSTLNVFQAEMTEITSCIHRPTQVTNQTITFLAIAAET